jgi:hypothetical protein
MRSERTTTQDTDIEITENDKIIKGLHDGSERARRFLGRVSGLLLGLRLSDTSSDENDRGELDTMRDQVEHASRVMLGQRDLIRDMNRVLRKMRDEATDQMTAIQKRDDDLRASLVEVRATYEIAEDIQRSLHTLKDRLRGKDTPITKEHASDEVLRLAVRLRAVEGNLNSVMERMEKKWDQSDG